jgi:hypothetical protein
MVYIRVARMIVTSRKNISIIFICFTLFMFGCRGHKMSRNLAEPYPAQIYAHLFSPSINPANKDFYDSTGNINIQISNSRNIPAVKLNGKPVSYTTKNKSFIDENVNINAGDSINLRITYKKSDGSIGITQANTVMPGQFQILDYDTSIVDTIALGSGFGAGWSKANDARYYKVQLTIDYTYMNHNYYDDVKKRFKTFHLQLDTICVDTQLALDSQRLFPDIEQIDSIHYSGGWFSIEAVKAPMYSGDESDFTGDGNGFIWTNTFGGRFKIAVEGKK